MDFPSLRRIDFYVSVVDNYGDMGFAVNFALSLHARHPNLRIRFFSDDLQLFQKFFPETPSWIEYLSLDMLTDKNPPAPEKLICSFFDYKFPKVYLASYPYEKTIVSFSYFLLHTGLESLHGTEYMLESGYDRVIHFVPSLLPNGGGVIINPLIEEKKDDILKNGGAEGRHVFLNNVLGINGNDIADKTWVSVFVYKDSLGGIIESMPHASKDTVFFIFGNDGCIGRYGNIICMPFLSLENYGVLQSLCDGNIVRGENSLCQALIAGKPALWDIYKEDNGAHIEKIEDYLAFLEGQFPEGEWDEYAMMMRLNNEKEQAPRFLAFLDFLDFGLNQYKEAFNEISIYVKEECNLIGKFEKMLEEK